MAASTTLCLVFIQLFVLGATTTVLTDGVKPFIMTRGIAVVGGTLTLTCTHSALGPGKSSPNLSVQWFQGDRLVKEARDQSLTLDNLSAEADGDYTCRVTDERNGTVTVSSAKAQVSVKIPPEVIIHENTAEMYKVPEGKNLTLTCAVTNKPRPQVVASDFNWTVQNLTQRGNSTEVSSQKFSLTDPKEKAGNSTPTISHQLTISPVTRVHSGRYTCLVNNDHNNTVGLPPVTRSIDVQIQYLDNVSFTTTQTVVAGNKVNLTCRVDSVPTATLTWLHQGHVLRTVESNEDVYSFTATGCQDLEYQCRADNEEAKKSTYGSTNVTVECPPTPAGQVDLAVVPELRGREGDSLTLAVNASGCPPPTYTWSGPVPLDSQPSVHLTDLQLWRHEGLYTVNVSNRHGFFLQKFKVVVLQQENVSVARGFSMDPSDPNFWLTIVGAVLVVLVILCIIAFVLQKRRELKGSRSRRPQNARPEASQEGEAMVARQHRRRRRPRHDHSRRPPNHSHGNHNHGGTGQRDPPVRVVARFPWHEPEGGNDESSPFVAPPSDPVDLPPSDPADLPPPDPVVPQQEEEGPPGPPFGPLAGIPMQIYPWAILPEAQSSESVDELQDKYGLPKNFRCRTPQDHPGTPSDAPQQADDLDPRSASEEVDVTQEDGGNQTYGTVDVVRGRRPRPSSLARGHGGPPAMLDPNPAPPKPHFRTLPTWDEVKDEEVVDLDVVPNAPTT